MATKNIIGAHPDGEYYHSSDVKNSRHASQGAGVIGHSLVVTVTEANRVITVPAFEAMVPDGSGGLVYVSHAGAGVNVTAADGSNPRNDILTLDSSGNIGMVDGAATAETGLVADAPTPTLDDDEILLAMVRIPAAQANVLAADVRPRGIDISENTMFTFKGTTIASGSYALPATNRQYYHISGTTTLAELGSKPAGFVLVLEFEGILTLTHDATNLVLQGGASYTTRAGDVLGFVSEGGGDWRQIFGPGRMAMYKIRTTSQGWTSDAELDPIAADSGSFVFTGHAGKTYRIRATFAATTTGTGNLNLSLTNNGGAGTAAAFRQTASIVYADGTAAVVSNATLTALGSVFAPQNVAATTFYEALLTVGTAGTFALEAAQGVSNGTVSTISWATFEVEEVVDAA